MSRRLGVILVLASGASFGFMPLFRSWAAGEVSVQMLLMLRFALAAAVLACLCAIQKQPFPRGRMIPILLGMGLGYFGEAYLYFKGLDYAPSGMISLLLYTYPAIVTILSVVLFKERLTRVKLAALTLAVIGSALTVIPGLLDQTHQHVRPLGIVLGLACACSYSAYVLVGGRLPKTTAALPSAVLVCTGAALAFAVVVVVNSFHNAEPLPHTIRAWTGIIALGLVCTVFGVTAFLAGLARTGPVRASTLSTFEPMMTAAVGVIALGETFGPLQIVGAVLIIAAAILSARATPNPADAASSTSSPPPAPADTKAPAPPDQPA
jgi:drug/metabolite transporter (DMT)-like permease